MVWPAYGRLRLEAFVSRAASSVQSHSPIRVPLVFISIS